MATFYLVEQDFLPHSSVENYKGDLVSIINKTEVDQMIANGQLVKDNVPNYKNAQCCFASVKSASLRGSFSLISKDKKLTRSSFGFILHPGHLMFLDEGQTVANIIKKIQKNKSHGSGVKLGKFIYEFLETIIENDLRYVEEMHDRLQKMESAASRGITDNFTNLVVSFNKEVLTFYRLYNQLIDLGTELQENENGFFDDSECELFAKFTNRASMLREETRFLKDMSNHVCDLYTGQVDTKMNKVMKLLTVVTTLCTPVTILTAWYGMNFEHMPEFDVEHAYPLFTIFSILTVVVSWWWLKKKKVV